MMTKEESLALAKKCGAVVDNFVSDDKSDYTVEFRRDEFAAYTSAIEEKYQAEKEALRLKLDAANMLVKMRPAPYADTDAGLVKQVQEYQKQIAVLNILLRESTGAPGMPNEWHKKVRKAVTDTQATADAWEAEVKARVWDTAIAIANKEHAKHCTGSGFDSQPSRNAAYRIREELIHQAHEECIITPSSSRICQRGTKSCIVEHISQQPRKPCTCDGWCDGLCLEKEGKRK